MREAENKLQFFDNEDDNEYSVDLYSEHGDQGLAEVAVARSRGAAVTKAKKRLTELLKELETLVVDGGDVYTPPKVDKE